MISFDLDFFPRDDARGDDLDDFENLLESWLASLLRNGNIINGWQNLELGDRVQVRAVAVAPDALEKRNWDTSAERDWAKLEPLFLTPPHFARVGGLPKEPTWCECAAPSGRVLFTTFLDEGSPVGCLDCGQDVPLYRLPHLRVGGDHNDFRGWQADFQALDQLWMGSSVGERFAYRQLARPKSDFMKETRELAARLESTSGVPTYSFLLHHHKKWGKRCPLCARKWTWKHSPRALLAFKCDHCRLVSSEASDEKTPLRELHP